MRGSSEKKKNLIIIAIEAVVLIIAVVCSLIMYRSQQGMIVDPATSYSSYAILDEGVWSVDTGEVEAGSFVTALETGALDLKFGSYKALIEYDTDMQQSMGMKSGGGSFRHTFSLMSPNSRCIDTRFELYSNSIPNLQMEFHCWGGSHFDIKSITIYPTFSLYMRMLTELVAFFIIADLLYMCRKKSWYKHFIRVSAMALLVTVPFLVNGVHMGHDYPFHLIRIEGIADGLRAGEFPVKMQPIWSDGYGLPVSVFYGDALLYIPAILRILGFFVTPAYLIFIFAVNLITSAVSYFSFGKIFNNERMGLILTAVYLSANYRLMDIYIRAAVGEYCAMAFLPLVALGMYGIYCCNVEEKRECLKNAIYLALGMTGIVESHLLSTEMVVIVLVGICLLLFRCTFRKETLTAFVLAAGIFVVLNLAFLVPFLDYYINVPVGINTGNGASGPIGSSAVYIGQYFQFFRDVFGDDSSVITERTPLTPGPILMITFVAGWVIWLQHRENKKLLVHLIASAALLFVSSDIFPWNVVAGFGAVGSVLTAIQFPWRYLSIVVVFLTLALGEILSTQAEGQNTTLAHATGPLILIAAMTVTGIFAGSYAEGADIRYYVDRNGFTDHALASWEYSIVTEDDEEMTYDVTSEGVEVTSDMTRHGCQASVSVNSTNGGWLELPIFAYKGYRAKAGDGSGLEVSLGSNGRIRIDIPSGYTGTVNLDFVQPAMWRAAEFISLVAWIVLIVFLCVKNRSKGRKVAL